MTGCITCGYLTSGGWIQNRVSSNRSSKACCQLIKFPSCNPKTFLLPVSWESFKRYHRSKVSLSTVKWFTPNSTTAFETVNSSTEVFHFFSMGLNPLGPPRMQRAVCWPNLTLADGWMGNFKPCKSFASWKTSYIEIWKEAVYILVIKELWNKSWFTERFKFIHITRITLPVFG